MDHGRSLCRPDFSNLLLDFENPPPHTCGQTLVFQEAPGLAAHPERLLSWVHFTLTWPESHPSCLSRVGCPRQTSPSPSCLGPGFSGPSTDRRDTVIAGSNGLSHAVTLGAGVVWPCASPPCHSSHSPPAHALTCRHTGTARHTCIHGAHTCMQTHTFTCAHTLLLSILNQAW